MNPTSVSGLFSRERMELDGNETFSSLSLSLLGTIPREALFISNETIMIGDFYREINPSLFPIPKRNRVKFESNDRLYDRRAKRAARKSVDFKRPALECLYGNFSGKRACRKPMNEGIFSTRSCFAFFPPICELHEFQGDFWILDFVSSSPNDAETRSSSGSDFTAESSERGIREILIINVPPS